MNESNYILDKHYKLYECRIKTNLNYTRESFNIYDLKDVIFKNPNDMILLHSNIANFNSTIPFLVNSSLNITNAQNKQNLQESQIIPTSIKYIDNFLLNIIILVDNEYLLFNFKNYLELFLNNPTITIYIQSTSQLTDITKILFPKQNYININNSGIVTRTNKFIKNIPIKKIRTDMLYYYDINYNIDNKLNCFHYTNVVDKIKIQTDILEYIHFDEQYIVWFLNKIFYNKLHLFYNKTIIISTKSHKILNSVSYLFLNSVMLEHIKLLYNWFSKSDTKNISLKQFTIFIFSYYFIKINKSPTIFYDFYYDYNIKLLPEYTNYLSFIFENNFIGNLIIFEESIEYTFNSIIHNTLEHIVNINLYTDISVKTKNVCILNNLKNNIIDNDNLLINNRFLNTNLDITANMLNIIKSYPYFNIYIFSDLVNYNTFHKLINKLPKENSILYDKNNKIIVRQIINSITLTEYKKTYINQFLFEYNNEYLTELLKTDTLTKYIARVEDILNINTDCIIISYLTKNNIINQKCIDFYKDYNICFINIFDIDIDLKYNKYKVLIVNSKYILKTQKKYIFIHPNQYFSNIKTNKYTLYREHLFKNINDLNSLIGSNKTYKNKKKQYITNNKLIILHNNLLIKKQESTVYYFFIKYNIKELYIIGSIFNITCLI